jgi:hypothetical protein
MENLRKQVISLQRAVKDHMDKPGSPAAKRLNTEIQALEDDMQVGKKALSVEVRVKRIIRLLEHDAKEARIMNYEHLELFRRKFERLREQVERLT